MIRLIGNKILFITILTLLAVLFQFESGSAQTNDVTKENLSQKSPGQYSNSDWAALIDSRWGTGLPTADKLILFDNLWTNMTSNFGAFHNLDVNVDSLHDIYRAEVEGGVSRGRFAAIMGHFMKAFNDGHTRVFEFGLNIGINLSSVQPGTPLMVIGAFRRNSHFGAVVTPMADDRILVYKVSNSHPIGLVRGDIILGYDGVPWMQLQEQLLEAQLPFMNNPFYASTRIATTRLTQMAAGLNWHLFDSIDILKQSTGDTLHFPTSSLNGQTATVYAQEGMDIPGVKWPNPDNNEYVSWGIVEGTQVGYVYATSWFNEPSRNIANLFRDAVDSLMNRNETTGIIFDYRKNTGGGSLAKAGYELLFNTNVETIGFDHRSSDPDDRFAMVPWISVKALTLNGDPNTFYDKPIAILFGPGSISAGDLEALRLQFHPMARSFGRPSNGAFTVSDEPSLGNSSWSFKKANGSAFLASDHTYLSHTAVSVDEEVWLEVDDVANGEDSVVKRAMEWMNELVYSHGAEVDRTAAIAGSDMINLVTKIHNPQSHSLFVQASLESESVRIDSIELFDDGLHGDGSANDGIWGVEFLAPSNEAHFKVNIETIDKESNISRMLPIATRFTTIGPIEYESHTLLLDTIPNPGDDVIFKLSLINQGLSVAGADLNVELSSDDACVASIGELSVNTYDEIAAGEIFESTGAYVVSLNESCSGMEEVRVDIVMTSERYHYWTDSLKFQLFPVGVDSETNILPIKNNLSNAYPNPFNPITTIEYELAETGEVQLIMYNMLGQEVARLVDGTMSAGRHQIIWDASQYSSGVYIYKLITNGFTETRKLILLK